MTMNVTAYTAAEEAATAMTDVVSVNAFVWLTIWELPIAHNTIGMIDATLAATISSKILSKCLDLVSSM